MTQKSGKIVLMGSGELTATMVEIHKRMLAGLPQPPRAVFLDTPAGFQLNVEEISGKAVEYFKRHVGHPLTVASYRSSSDTGELDTETAFRLLRNANFVLIGPGSPTYTVRHLRETPVPGIISKMIQSGGCLEAASAAALTMGRFTLPVYEIYKVGQEIHWIDGLDLLSSFGLNVVVVPHWNNAEGGTHDTRFCFMGKPRFQRLEALLPDEVVTLGIDEHTACILDLEARCMEIQGIGGVTVRRRGREIKIEKGNRVSLEILTEHARQEEWKPAETGEEAPPESREDTETNFSRKVESIEVSFQSGMANHDPETMVRALLELDGEIWKAQKELADDVRITQARMLLRDAIVLLGAEADISPRRLQVFLTPLVDRLLQFRERLRKEHKWSEADQIRDILQQANILVEDTEEGFQWRMIDDSH